MNTTISTGRALVALPFIVFGIQQLITGSLLSALMPASLRGSAELAGAYLSGATLVVASLLIILQIRARAASWVLFILFSLSILVLHLPKLIASPYEGGLWTPAFEMVGMAGAILILLGTYSDTPAVRTSRIGQLLFAGSLVIFGIQHLMYGLYVATLIPAWIPVPVFWAYGIGIAFFAAAISIIIKLKVYWAMALQAAMFIFWVLFLHAPRVISNPTNRNELTSAFVAMAFAGCSLILAGLEKKSSPEWVPVNLHSEI
jgi:uncharacterized membrane protein YphA (DoxX/SURF4 family)